MSARIALSKCWHSGIKPARTLSGLCLLLTLHTLASVQQLPLTKAAQVHDLPANLAAKQLPVQLTATVTYYEPNENTLFVADSSGAVYVKTTHPYPIHRGDLVRIEGVTAKSFRATVAKNPKIEVIGKGTLTPATVRTYRSYREMMAGKWDCQYVTLNGVVRSALFENHQDSRVLELEILMHGGIVQAYLQDYRGIDPGRLIDAEVNILGVVGGDFNAQWQLMRGVIYAADASDVRIIRQPRLGPSSLPLTDIDRVMQTHSVNDRSLRVRVRGTLIYYRPGYTAVIQQNGRSLYASTRQIDPLPLGSVVDMVGFAEDGGYSPTLGQTEIFRTGQFQHIEPAPVSYAQAIGGAYSDNLVSLRGRIISQLHADSSDTLLLNIDSHAVTIVLQTREGTERLPDLPNGAVVSVVGICRITPTTVWGSPGASPLLFRLDMRTSDDLRILSSPSWWTVAHLLVVVGALVSLSLLIAAWAVVLRRRVARQTATIERTMRLEKARGRLLEEINSEIALEQLLENIRTSVEALAPGLHCCCDITDSSSEAAGVFRTTRVGEQPAYVIYEAALADIKGRKIGAFSAAAYCARSLSEDENEVLTVHTGLASLAMNQRRMYEELNYTSTHDQLTSLPNRRLSDLYLDAELQDATLKGTRVGVAYIDIDRFKQVNDEHGHKAGDLYLQQIAARLISKVRNVDKLARIGGDEFLLIASAMHSIEDVDAYRHRLESCFEDGFVLDGARVRGSASIGIAVFPDHGINAEELKRHADIDMYGAKRRRRGEQEHRPRVSGETNIYSPADLRSALESGQFRLFYQPQFSSRGELRGFEALLRLHDPILGIVTPDAFIDVAERDELIIPLGAWVLHQALADAGRWNLHNMNDIRMVVNVSARQIEHTGFADGVMAALEDAEMPACILEIEITERTLSRDIAQAMRQLDRLRAEGVRISIDDFGMEHSCLSILHKLPIDTLKIDRTFVRGLHTEPKVLHIISAIVSMGNAMQKRIVAEGVETEGDIQALLKLGTMDLQGFFFSRPQPFDIISIKLDVWRAGLHIDAQCQDSASPSTLS